MSEYPYYEFLAIDRPLTKDELDELRALSTRATITPVSFTNEYNWGDSRRDHDNLMQRCFDAHVYVVKGLLPYHGLGSGIARALDVWLQINFIDDRDGCLFTANVQRKEVVEHTQTEEPMKASGKILINLKQDKNLTIPDLARLIGVTDRSVERNIRKLQDQDLLQRIGPAKGGYWEVIDRWGCRNTTEKRWV